MYFLLLLLPHQTSINSCTAVKEPIREKTVASESLKSISFCSLRYRVINLFWESNNSVLDQNSCLVKQRSYILYIQQIGENSFKKKYTKIKLCFFRQWGYANLILAFPAGKIYGVGTYFINVLTGFELILTIGIWIALKSLISNSLPVNALLYRDLISCHKIYYLAVPFLLAFNIF